MSRFINLIKNRYRDSFQLTPRAHLKSWSNDWFSFKCSQPTDPGEPGADSEPQVRDTGLDG